MAHAYSVEIQNYISDKIAVAEQEKQNAIKQGNDKKEKFMRAS